MLNPSDLTREQLIDVVTQVRNLLWREFNEGTDVESLNPDKEWDGETLEYVAGVLEDYGLAPTKEARP
jgi:hypothetical protein